MFQEYTFVDIKLLIYVEQILEFRIELYWSYNFHIYITLLTISV